MKAKVYVTLKPGVLDPQGKAIHHSVELLGYERIAESGRESISRSRSTRRSERKPANRLKRSPKTFWQIRSSKIIEWRSLIDESRTS